MISRRQNAASTRVKPAPPAKASKARPKLQAANAPRRTRLSPDERRMRIIDAAEALFKTQRYSQISVGDVARTAGITQGLVYHYFPTKDALFAAALQQRAADLIGSAALDSSAPFAEQVERAVQGYMDWVESHSIAYLNLLRSPDAAEPQFFAITETAREVIIDNLLDALGIERDRAPATRLSLRGYLGYTESTVARWLEQKPVPRTALERMIIFTLVSALRTGLSNEADAGAATAPLARLEDAQRDLEHTSDSA